MTIKFLNKLKKINKKIFSIIMLKWIFTFGNIISGVFINIYVYKNFNSIESVILYNIGLYTFLFIGFSLFGILISKLKIDLKKLFYLSYFNFVLSFLILIFSKNIFFSILFFALFYGIGMGNYYAAIQFYELRETKEKIRDFYQSILSAGIKLLYIITPLLVSIIFYLNNSNPYQILFILSTIIYFLSFFFIKNIDSYFPKKIRVRQIKRFFRVKNLPILSYFLTDSVTFTIPNILINILLIYILKTEVNLGIYQSILGIFSIIIILVLSINRNSQNRLKIMFITGIIIFLSFIFLGLNGAILGIIIFSLIDTLISPLYKISVSVYDMNFIEDLSKSKKDIFPTMIFRELILWLGRISVFIIILIIIKFNQNNLSDTFLYSFIILGFFYILSPYFVYIAKK